MPEKFSIYVPIITGLMFLAGVLSPLLFRLLGRRTGLFLSLFPLVFFVALFFHLPVIGESKALITPGFFNIAESIDFSFRIDGLSITFGLMISGIGFFVMLYSAYYMSAYGRQSQYYLYLTLFMGAMTAMVFADNLISLFIFWELTSITSFLLIGFEYQSAKARQAALQSLLITAFGGLCLLFAFILTGEIAGTYRISEIISTGFTLASHPQSLMVFILVLIAVLTKSAQFPFHFWLPGAMNARSEERRVGKQCR